MSHRTKLQKLRQHREVKVWYPRASDLVLSDVPESKRAEVRRILGWLDGKFPVHAGTCWRTAQAVTLLARDPRVQYVEGVSWNVKRIGADRYAPLFQHDGECTSSVCACKPLPHAYNLVNGHVVDLLAEFYNWRFGSEYLHEPLKVYSLEDIPVGGVSGSIFQKQTESENCGRFEGMTKAEICQLVFQEASDRLAAREIVGRKYDG